MNKLYSVHDHWTDINKKNDVDIESIDGVITGIKVNGKDYGGGSSDFSTAQVTFSSETFQTDFSAIQIVESEDYEQEIEYENVIFGGNPGDKTYSLVLYKGLQRVILPEGKRATVTGSASVEEFDILVTGDCTITIS